MARTAARTQGNDYRDETAVRAWAASIAATLTGPSA
jgi:hypothetical protein